MDSIEVLLVEDNHADVFAFKNIIKGTADYMHMPKISIGVCHSIKEAKEFLSSNKYDVILLDMYLPDSTELEGLKILIENFPEIAIVIYSEVYSTTLASEAISIGAEDYIVKGTVSTDELVRILVHAKLRHDTIRKLCNLMRTQ